jgi:hypothetical protein
MRGNHSGLPGPADRTARRDSWSCAESGDPVGAGGCGSTLMVSDGSGTRAHQQGDGCRGRREETSAQWRPKGGEEHPRRGQAGPAARRHQPHGATVRASRSDRDRQADRGGRPRVHPPPAGPDTPQPGQERAVPLVQRPRTARELRRRDRHCPPPWQQRRMLPAASTEPRMFAPSRRPTTTSPCCMRDATTQSRLTEAWRIPCTSAGLIASATPAST